METKFSFILMEPAEFGPWLQHQPVNRIINMIQNHHTWLPNYSSFNGRNHFEKLVNMRRSHMVDRGFSDIAQNITTFPDGKIAVCRPLEVSPAGIKGWNSKAICIEHIGDFDKGKDVMTREHRDAIVLVNAFLCHKFSLLPSTDSIVYHHWYDLNTLKRTNGTGSTKSCPGSAFFGGNSVQHAETGFIPLIKTQLVQITGPAITPPHGYPTGIVVDVTSLRIRKGPGTNYEVTGSLQPGSVINIMAEVEGWYRVSEVNAWVSSRYVLKVQKGTAHTNVNIRKGPGADFEKLGVLAKGTEFFVFETRNDWHRIDFIDKWVKGQYITIS